MTEYTEGAGEPERMDTSCEVAELVALRAEKMSEPTSDNESSGRSSIVREREGRATDEMWQAYKKATR